MKNGYFGFGQRQPEIVGQTVQCFILTWIRLPSNMVSVGCTHHNLLVTLFVPDLLPSSSDSEGERERKSSRSRAHSSKGGGHFSALTTIVTCSTRTQPCNRLDRDAQCTFNYQYMRAAHFNTVPNALRRHIANVKIFNCRLRYGPATLHWHSLI